jgi:hypothetical protein
VDREYRAFPSTRAPAYLVQDTPAALDYFFTSVATVPPGVCALAPVADLALRVLRLMLRSRMALALAPGRVVIGARR